MDLFTLIYTIVTYTTLLLVVIYSYQVYRYFSSDINCSFPLPLVGHAHILGLDFKNYRENIFKLIDAFKKDGKLRLLIGPYTTFIGVVDPALVEQLLSSSTFIEKSDEYELFAPWLGEGLLLSGGKKWHSRRKTLTPAFHFEILNGLVSTIDGIIDHLMEKWRGQADGTTIRIDHDVELYALDIICETIMGVEINAQAQGEALDYVHATFELTRMCYERMLGVFTRMDWYFNLTRDGRMFKTYCNLIHTWTDDVIKSRRKVIVEKMADDSTYATEYCEGKKGKINFLDTLLMSKQTDGRPFLDTDIRAEVNTFMFEGHDTTSTAITFCMYELSRNPHVQAKVYQEIIDVCGKDTRMTNESVSNLKYLELVIKETMRLYPSVPIIGRRVKEDVMLGDTLLPKNTSIVVPIFYLHRQADAFEAPDDFRPERFDSGQHNPFQYVPFSAGPRNCIGQKFAMLEMKTLLAKVLINFELIEAVDAPKPRQIINVIMKSLTGVHVRLMKRV